MLPQSRPKTENSNRHTSKPEIDFVKIPTAFSNVQGALKMPLEIFRQGALEGVELEKWASAQKSLNPNISKTKFNLFLKILVMLECIVFLRLKRSVENRWSEKSYGPRKWFLTWGVLTLKLSPTVPCVSRHFVGGHVPFKARYYSV